MKGLPELLKNELQQSFGEKYIEWETKQVLLRLINQYDNVSEDKTKLEIAGRIINLIKRALL